MIRFRQINRVIDVDRLPVRGNHFVNYARIGGDDVHVELTPKRS